MSFRAATEVYSKPFDSAFFALPAGLQQQIEASIHDMGRRLDRFPHHRLKGSADCRLRVGDYRVIYCFDLNENALYLLSVGHRSKIYR